ncbi:MAG: FAD-dependent oxidoreductase [Solirubrobacterales bacterium]|nr:FAD-dependent oxidoreductase [Solirubrobacterales bacterium]
MTGSSPDVVVVGAGPAGIAAALAAASSGAAVTLIDEGSRPGGQIWRRPAPELDPAAAEPAAAVRELQRAPVRVLTDTVAWGADSERTLLLGGPDGSAQRLRPRAIVVATGGHDRPIALPGWTLPGVLTAGGAQALVKGQCVRPGARALVVGAGPFGLVAALGLAGAGTEVVAVLEATTRRTLARHADRAALHPERLLDLARYRRALRRAGVPVLAGRGIVRVEGPDRVRGAILVRLDGDWRPMPGTERRLEVDCVCLAYGFVPAVDLAAALGCEIRWDARGQQRAVVVDREQRTIAAGVFAAGEATGIGGAGLARAEGAVAGAAAAAEAGFGAGPSDAARRARRRHRHLAALLADAYAPRPGVWELAGEDTVVCRCEGVTAGAVRAAAAAGAASPNELKRTTRVGMGPCQGRMCAGLVARLIAEVIGRPAAAGESFTVRPPLRPVPLRTLAALGR